MADEWATETGRWRMFVRAVVGTGLEDGRRRFPRDEVWTEDTRAQHRRYRIKRVVWAVLERLLYLVVMAWLGLDP